MRAKVMEHTSKEAEVTQGCTKMLEEWTSNGFGKGKMCLCNQSSPPY